MSHPFLALGSSYPDVWIAAWKEMLPLLKTSVGKAEIAEVFRERVSARRVHESDLRVLAALGTDGRGVLRGFLTARPPQLSEVQVLDALVESLAGEVSPEESVWLGKVFRAHGRDDGLEALSRWDELHRLEKVVIAPDAPGIDGLEDRARQALSAQGEGFLFERRHQALADALDSWIAADGAGERAIARARLERLLGEGTAAAR